MTFVLEGTDALIVFGLLFAILLIVLRDLSLDAPWGACPSHPDQDECAHRKKRK